jgi:hypothetical protein
MELASEDGKEEKKIALCGGGFGIPVFFLAGCGSTIWWLTFSQLTTRRFFVFCINDFLDEDEVNWFYFVEVDLKKWNFLKYDQVRFLVKFFLQMIFLQSGLIPERKSPKWLVPEAGLELGLAVKAILGCLDEGCWPA